MPLRKSIKAAASIKQQNKYNSKPQSTTTTSNSNKQKQPYQHRMSCFSFLSSFSSITKLPMWIKLKIKNARRV
jgi:DNA/RNA endonuclease G (NUC1)